MLDPLLVSRYDRDSPRRASRLGRDPKCGNKKSARLTRDDVAGRNIKFNDRKDGPMECLLLLPTLIHRFRKVRTRYQWPGTSSNFTLMTLCTLTLHTCFRSLRKEGELCGGCVISKRAILLLCPSVNNIVCCFVFLLGNMGKIVERH